MKLKDKDKGLRWLSRRIGRLGAVVGVTDPDCLEIGKIHEFGAPAANIPQRSFLRGPIDAASEHLYTIARNIAYQHWFGKVSAEKCVEVIGSAMQKVVVDAINAHIDPPNKPATVARKGSDVPLVETGQLRDSIGHEPLD